MDTSRLTPLVVALSLFAPVAVGAQDVEPAMERASLEVPYVPQSAALCGGAAVAMLFRYWGDAHAAAEQFAPLIDWRAGGIADDVLVDAVRQRGWRAEPIDGSLPRLRDQISEGHPVIILVEDRPTRYHYLVVIGADARGVLVHDPSWGPSRWLAAADLVRVWRPTNFWGLVVLPSETQPVSSTTGTDSPMRAIGPSSSCDLWLDAAIDRIRARGLDTADEALGEVSSRCPGMAGPLRELAGVRFAQRRWRDAAALASEAVARDPGDAYAWDVLASSRFMQDDYTGALSAWNRIGKPRVDAVDITGLRHTRYQRMAEALAIEPNQLLTADAFARASRRLNELPDRSSTRMAFNPSEDGFAAVDVAIAERGALPQGAVEWGMVGARSLADREFDVSVPGFTGQGESWSASWRWWSGRPRVAIAFAAPHVGPLPGVWRVDGSWESQRYVGSGSTAFISETRAHSGLTVSDWLTGSLRYSMSTGFDEWNGTRRTASVGASLERRFFADRVSLQTNASGFIPIADSAPFGTVNVSANLETSTAAVGWVLDAAADATAVTSDSPLALWPGAGSGHARPALLRAHPLLRSGAIGGPAFGQTLLHSTAETTRWLDFHGPIRFALAGFGDTALAEHRLPSETGAPWQLDVGGGLRMKGPGPTGTLRADFARGLRDGATAFTVGWHTRTKSLPPDNLLARPSIYVP